MSRDPHMTDESSLPSLFQAQWRSNPDPSALPFPRNHPPFALTQTDWHQLTLRDEDFTPHTWTEASHLIATHQLEALKRWPSDLKAYLAWTAHVGEKYGGATTYLLDQRLGWKAIQDTTDHLTDALRFEVRNTTPFSHKEDYRILANDWPYAFEPGITHIVVWLKQRLPVDRQGALSEEGRAMVEAFVKRVFRQRAGEREGEEGSRVVWFKNTTNLQSVRGLEHVHVLVRGVSEGILGEWLG